jgi:transcriptional regulator NrdR family protein
MKTMCEICGKNLGEQKKEHFLGVYRRRACEKCFDRYSAFLTSSEEKAGGVTRNIINKFHNIGILQSYEEKKGAKEK